MVPLNSFTLKSSAQIIARSSEMAHSKALAILYMNKIGYRKLVDPTGSYSRRKIQVRTEGQQSFVCSRSAQFGEVNAAEAAEALCLHVLGLLD